MKSKRIERLHADKINDFLEDCDMVKFAKYEPAPVEILWQNNEAKSVIDKTKEVIVQEEIPELEGAGNRRRQDCDRPQP